MASWLWLGLLAVLVGGSLAGGVSDEVVAGFERRNNLRKGSTRSDMMFQVRCGDTKLPTGSGWVEVELYPVQPSFEVMQDGEKVDPKTLDLMPLYRGTVVGTEGISIMTMLCDRDGSVKHVSMSMGGSHVGSLMPLDDQFPGMVAFVDAGSMDVESMKGLNMNDMMSPKKSKAARIERHQNLRTTSEAPPAREDLLSGVAASARQTEIRVLEVAVTFERTFCARFGGMSGASSMIEAIYESVSSEIYEPLFGLKLKVTLIDGYCNAGPYDDIPNGSGCNGSGMLQGVYTYWNENRAKRAVKRDLVAFLTNREFDDRGTLGCAYVGKICEKLGFSTNSINFSDNFDAWMTLIAHETGHNVGADHAGSGFMHKFLDVTTTAHPDTMSEIHAEINSKKKCLPIDGTCTNAFQEVVECSCETGFIANASNGFSCSDVNECNQNPDICGHPDFICKNRPGSYDCICPSDKDCSTSAPKCSSDPCDNGYECIDLNRGGYLCADIDECEAGLDNCDGDEVCMNTDGGFTCVSDCSSRPCSGGYDCIDVYGGGFLCVDINECEAGADDCSASQKCLNSDGGFLCVSQPGSCPDGYTERNGICVDIDECAEGLDDCGIGAVCLNSDGGFVCRCTDDSLTPNEDKHCVVDDLCLSNPCSTDFECSVTAAGKRKCTCDDSCFFKQRDPLKRSTCNCDENCRDWRERCTRNDQCCSFKCNKNRGFCV